MSEFNFLCYFFLALCTKHYATLIRNYARDPDILSGTPVFVGTRVPVRSLFDDLEGGDSLEEFSRQFPSVKHSQAVAVLEAACARVSSDAAFA